MRVVMLCLSLAVSALVTTMAAAQTAGDDEARLAFEEGRAAYDAGRFEEALAAFQRAHALTGNAEILYNVATVADRLRRDTVALEAYEGYLAAYPAAPDRANVEARIAAIRSALASDAPEVEPPVAGNVEGNVEGAVEPSEADEPAPVRRPTPARPPPSNDGGYALLVAGGVLAALGAALLIVSAVETEAASRAETWAELRGPWERVPLESAVGWLSLGLGVAMGALGAGWLVMNGSATSEHVAVRVGPGGLSLSGAF